MSPVGGCPTPFICPIVIPPNESDAAEASCDDRVRLKQLQDGLGLFGNDLSHKWCCQICPIGTRPADLPPDLADLMPNNASLHQPGSILHRTLESIVQDLRDNSHLDNSPVVDLPLTPMVPTSTERTSRGGSSGAGRLPRRRVLPLLFTPSASVFLTRNSSNRITIDPNASNIPIVTRPSVADLSVVSAANSFPGSHQNPGNGEDNEDDDFFVDQDDETELVSAPDE